MSSGGSSPLLLFRITGTSLPPADRRALKEFACELSDRIAEGRPFTCLLSGDRELRRLNKSFLSHDYPTDVLSFPSAQAERDLGEIAISTQRAQAQADRFGHTLLEEIKVLMLHGVLHLTGMDHERDHGSMARAERKWRGVLALPVNLIARSEAEASPR